MNASSPRSPRRRAALRVIVFAVTVVGLWGLGQLVDLVGLVQSLRSWAHEIGDWAPGAYGGLYVLAALTGVPGTPLTVLAAILFGPLIGFVVMVVATAVTSVVAFWLARTVARASLERWLSRRPSYERFQTMLHKHQWTAIPLVRIMPVFPYALVNYGLGLSRVPFWKYFVASEIAMVPMNAVWILSAESVYRLVLRGEMPWKLLVLMTAAGLLLLGVFALTRFLIEAGNRTQEVA